MNGSSGAGQGAVGGAGGAMAATSTPASVPAIKIDQNTFQPTPSITDQVLTGAGKGLMGFGDLMKNQQAPRLGASTQVNQGAAAPTVANYTLPPAGDPFGGSGLQSLDPNILKALLSRTS